VKSARTGSTVARRSQLTPSAKRAYGDAVRILITTPAGVGHVHPMVPLAVALRDRGHDVLWATGPDTRAWAEAAGIRAVTAGIGGGQMAEFWRRYPQARSLARTEVPDFMFPRMFGEIAAPVMLADLLRVTSDWAPQLVVHDAAEFAGPIVAAKFGVANVVKSFGPLLPPQRVAAAAEEVAPLWRSVGLDPRPFGGCYERLYLDVYPPGLQAASFDHVPHCQPLRPVADDVSLAGATLDEQAIAALGEGPLVYVTMGTIFNDPGPLRSVLEGLRDLSGPILVTVGPAGDPALLGEQPANVRVERYVAQSAVFGHCAAVVSHGGSGTALSALGHGLPQLCLPQGADQFSNAECIAAFGAGLALLPDEATPERIGTAVRRLLDEPSFANSAAAMADVIRQMPGPAEVALVLEALA